MNEQKLYAVKDDKGYYWDFGYLGGFWQLESIARPVTSSKEVAKTAAKEHGGHVVAFVRSLKR